MSLIPVNSNDIVVGRPIPWTLYNEHYTLLLSDGEVVRDEKHRNELLSNGAYRELSWETSSTIDTTPYPAEVEKSDATFTFEDIRLKVEDRLQLEPQSQPGHERFSVKVIGFLKGVSLLVTAPIGSDGLRVLLKENDKVVLRSFSGVNAFAFISTVTRIFTIPYAYMHLSFPDSVQGIKIRSTPRIKSNIVATVQKSSDTSTQISAVISDINTNGASLVSKQPLGNTGDNLHMNFRVHLHNVEAFLSVNGIIRTVTHDDEPDAKKNGLTRHGIEFQDTQPSDYVVLQSLIYQQMIENPHRVM
jgi:hypothetical protein